MSKRRSNKSVKRMICGILAEKSANCDVSVKFINGKITVILDGAAFNFTQGVASFDSSFNPISDNRASLIVSAVGSTVISISECNPATFDQVGYEELEFTEIGTASELKGGVMVDKKGRIIKVGMKIKHIHHSQIATVHWKNGELYAGNVPIATYHSSVIEIVD